MTWFLSLLCSAITAVVGAVLAGFVASLAADWYNVPSREGEAGYFVVGFILLGLIAGAAIGLITSRVVGARPDPRFLKAVGLSQMALVSVVLPIGIVTRLLADVGPTIEGKSLILNVELRWPEGAELPPDTSNGWFLRLSSVNGRTVRTSETGPLWREDARHEDGRWIVPGAVDLFTSRGGRLISFEPQGLIPTGYVVPVPAWPGRGKLAWSEWLPQLRPGSPPLPGGVTYRWRLVPEDQSLRVQRFGPFEVSTIARSVDATRYTRQPRTWTADADFTIRYRGQPVVMEGKAAEGDSTVRYELAQAVALLPGADTALLVLVNGMRGSGDIWLLAPEGERLRADAIVRNTSWESAEFITSDPALFQQRVTRTHTRGRVELTEFAAPGLYLFRGAVFDNRDRSVRPFSTEGKYNLLERLPPLALSPDQRSFARLGYQPETTEAYLLEVFDLVSGANYQLPVDRYRMRFGRIDDLDPGLVSRFFEWSRGADGTDHLIPRAHPVPPPYRGVMTDDDPDYREYRVYLATPALRAAMIDWLIQEFQAERFPTDSAAYAQVVKINGQAVYLGWDASDEHVGVWVDRGSDTGLVTRIAERWNAAIASGKYDGLFAHGK